MLRTEANGRDVVEAFYTRILSATTAADLPARLSTVLSPHWQSLGDYRSPVKTREQFLAQLQQLGGVLPDLTWHLEEVLEVGNRFAVRGRATATPVGPFLGIAPTGRSFEIMAIDLHTVENGRIVKSYHVEDWLGAVGQLQAQN